MGVGVGWRAGWLAGEQAGGLAGGWLVSGRASKGCPASTIAAAFAHPVLRRYCVQQSAACWLVSECGGEGGRGGGVSVGVCVCVCVAVSVSGGAQL